MDKIKLQFLLSTGHSYTSAAIELGVTKQCVSALCRKKGWKKLPLPPKPLTAHGIRRKAFNLDPELYLLASEKFTRKKNNVLRAGRNRKWEFTVKFEDIFWPTHCPILGLELLYNSPFDKKQEASVSFDRIDSNKGYIPGNVHIISWRANRIKNDGTPEEHRLIYEYFTKLETESNCEPSQTI